MAKKKLKADSVVNLWKRLSGLYTGYLNKKSYDAVLPVLNEEETEVLNEIVKEINSSGVPDSITSSFIIPYLNTDNLIFRFMAAYDAENYGVATYVEKRSYFIMNLIEFLKFVNKVYSAGQYIKDNMEIREDVTVHRQYAFMKELAKLPEPYLVYIAVLQEVAVVNDIVSIEHRNGGYIKSDSAGYLSLLWAFKEFEGFYLRMQHRNLRADYGIIWHEGNWVEERKTRGYV